MQYTAKTCREFKLLVWALGQVATAARKTCSVRATAVDSETVLSATRGLLSRIMIGCCAAAVEEQGPGCHRVQQLARATV
jgi:hypothetical protein